MRLVVSRVINIVVRYVGYQPRQAVNYIVISIAVNFNLTPSYSCADISIFLGLLKLYSTLRLLVVP